MSVEQPYLSSQGKWYRFFTKIVTGGYNTSVLFMNDFLQICYTSQKRKKNLILAGLPFAFLTSCPPKSMWL